MPHKDKKTTMIRQWEMLKLLPKGTAGPWIKASEIALRLKDEGYEVSVRTVQRDLKELSAIFPIELNDKNPRDYGWRWMKGAHFDIPGMNISEAFAMRLVDMYLKPLMPSSIRDTLQGVFSQAKSRLECVAKPNEWVNKVKIVPTSQALIPARVEETVQAVIYEALLESRRVTASYRPPHTQDAMEYVLNPLGLIMRGPVSYLVATAWNYQDLRLYAMHRIGRAEILDEACRIPEGFDLERELARGFADFTGGGTPIRLEFLCMNSEAFYLEETPLSEDQEMLVTDEGWIRIHATVNDTWQLRWWLLSKGGRLEVLAPEDLRKEIAEEYKVATLRYDSTSKY